MARKLSKNQKYALVLFGLKIILAGLFTSEYKELLFVPFVEQFLGSFSNPWQAYFVSGARLDAFPYHPLMLYSLVLSYGPVYWLSIKSFFLLNLFFKIPLLAADLLIFFLLLKKFPQKYREVLLFYFANPIVIYVTFIHSQMDLPAVALLFLSISLVEKDKPWRSAVAMGLSLAFKSQVILALPLLGIYLWKRKPHVGFVLSYCSVVVLVFSLLVLPYGLSEGYDAMVWSAASKHKIFSFFLVIGGLKVYVLLVVILLVYARCFMFKKINYDVLQAMMAVLFISVILCVGPAPAWILWGIPFVSAYFIKAYATERRVLLFYLAVLAAYFGYFLFFYRSPYADVMFLGQTYSLNVNSPDLTNLAFSVFEAAFIGLLFVMLRHALKSNQIYAKKTNFLIGIGGDSGAGKSTLLQLFSGLFDGKIARLEGDGDHKWERSDAQWEEYTHLNPKANFIHRQAQDLINLKHGRTVFRTEYDHKDGRLVQGQATHPKEFVVLSGLHPFYLPKMRQIIDLKIFLDTDETLRLHWKAQRDIKERNHTLETVQAQLEKRRPDREKYIIPQRGFADLCIQLFAVGDFEIGKETPKLGLKVTLDVHVNVEQLVQLCWEAKLQVEWDYADDLSTQHLIFQEEPQEVNFEHWSSRLIPNVEELVSTNVEWHRGFNGVTQLIALLMISEHMAGGHDEAL